VNPINNMLVGFSVKSFSISVFSNAWLTLWVQWWTLVPSHCPTSITYYSIFSCLFKFLIGIKINNFVFNNLEAVPCITENWTVTPSRFSWNMSCSSFILSYPASWAAQLDQVRPVQQGWAVGGGGGVVWGVVGLIITELRCWPTSPTAETLSIVRPGAEGRSGGVYKYLLHGEEGVGEEPREERTELGLVLPCVMMFNHIHISYKPSANRMLFSVRIL